MSDGHLYPGGDPHLDERQLRPLSEDETQQIIEYLRSKGIDCKPENNKEAKNNEKH